MTYLKYACDLLKSKIVKLIDVYYFNKFFAHTIMPAHREADMSNPFLKKNPFMSLWLSGAYSVIGKSRAATQAAARRQQKTAGTEAAKAIAGFWTGLFSRPTTGKRRRSRR
jgi:hypothetical protein